MNSTMCSTIFAEIALKQPVKDKQKVLMTDASFVAAGNAL